MNSLMSINYKFKEISPKELVNLVLNKSMYTKGFEVSFNAFDESDKEYVTSLAYECFKNNLILQIHGDSSLTIEKQKEYLKFVESLYDIVKKQIVMTIHSVQNNNKEKSIEETYSYINEMLKTCNQNKIKLCLENLNDYRSNEDRLDKKDIIPIVCNIEKLYMTYDIGHELIEYGKVTEFNEKATDLIANVHIHSYSYNYSEGYDHKPIIKNDEHWNDLLKGIMFLKSINYKGNIAFEYDLFACEGNNKVEKIIYFLKSIDYVSERI